MSVIKSLKIESSESWIARAVQARRRARPGFGGWSMLFCLCTCVSAPGSTALARDSVNFAGKSITLLVGFSSGGGTDIAARVIAQSLGKHLPGEPTIVVQNMPGAEGFTAMKYFIRQVKPDGLTLTMGSASLADPLHYRARPLKYDPRSLEFIAGSGRGGSVLVINKNAKPRLYDRARRPVTVGSTTGIPRAGMLMASWGSQFLGWNTKWVIGYPGTSNLLLALHRGEIDMTSTSDMPTVHALVTSGHFEILAQTGETQNGVLVGRPELGTAPVFDDLIKGKIRDSIQRKCFRYWEVLNDMDKWLALPPHTPRRMLQVYRKAYDQMEHDPQFLAETKKISDDFEPRSGAEVKSMVDELYNTPSEAIAYINAMLRSEGLTTD